VLGGMLFPDLNLRAVLIIVALVALVLGWMP
jgi:hypothetical protein